MSDTLTATVRTTVSSGWIVLVVTALNRLFGWEVTVDDLLPFVPVWMVLVGVSYRLFRLVESRVPWLGYVLFGSARQPSYAPPPPPPPAG